MTDLLIRNVSPELRRAIEASARRHRRSLSDEAKLLLQRGVSGSAAQGGKLDAGIGTRLARLGRNAGEWRDILPPREDVGRATPFSS